MPQMFNAATRRQIEKAALAMLTERCTIEQELEIDTQYGTTTKTWVVIAENVHCRVIKNGQTIDSQTELVGGQESIINAPRLVCPKTTPLAKDQRVTVSGETYTLTGIKTTLTDRVLAEAFLARAK